MRGADYQQSHMFSYLSPEARVRKDHPLRAIRTMVDEVLRALSPQFDCMYASEGRPSIAPEKLRGNKMTPLTPNAAIPSSKLCFNRVRADRTWPLSGFCAVQTLVLIPSSSTCTSALALRRDSKYW